MSSGTCHREALAYLWPCPDCDGLGVLLYDEAPYITEHPCPTCSATGIDPEALAILLGVQ